MGKKVAFITGITGQDGSYLAESLLKDGYEVHGLVRRVAAESQQARLGRIAHLLGHLRLHDGDICFLGSVDHALSEARPTEVYHLAAQSHVGRSFEDHGATSGTNFEGTIFLLRTVKQVAPEARVYFAGSSEQFGDQPPPQGIDTEMKPVSPYGESKRDAWNECGLMRDHYQLWVARGILFNHESPRRGDEFVTRKVTQHVGKLMAGYSNGPLRLGDLSPRRDWGHAREYVEAMRLMLAQDQPQDYVVGTGVSHSVEEWVAAAFTAGGFNWRDHVEIDESLKRPAEIRELRAEPSYPPGWAPATTFEDLVAEMVRKDFERCRLLRSQSV